MGFDDVENNAMHQSFPRSPSRSNHVLSEAAKVLRKIKSDSAVQNEKEALLDYLRDITDQILYHGLVKDEFDESNQIDKSKADQPEGKPLLLDLQRDRKSMESTHFTKKIDFLDLASVKLARLQVESFLIDPSKPYDACGSEIFSVSSECDHPNQLNIKNTYQNSFWSDTRPLRNYSSQDRSILTKELKKIFRFTRQSVPISNGVCPLALLENFLQNEKVWDICGASTVSRITAKFRTFDRRHPVSQDIFFSIIDAEFDRKGDKINANGKKLKREPKVDKIRNYENAVDFSNFDTYNFLQRYPGK